MAAAAVGVEGDPAGSFGIVLKPVGASENFFTTSLGDIEFI